MVSLKNIDLQKTTAQELAQAQKDADEVSFFERTVGSNQGDIDKLNSLTKELTRLRETIAAADRSAPSIDQSQKNIDQRDQSSKVTTTMTPMRNPEQFSIPY